MKVAWLVWVMEVVQMEVLSEEKMATVAREAEEMVQAMVEVVMAAEPKVVVSMGVASGEDCWGEIEVVAVAELETEEAASEVMLVEAGRGTVKVAGEWVVVQMEETEAAEREAAALEEVKQAVGMEARLRRKGQRCSRMNSSHPKQDWSPEDTGTVCRLLSAA